MNYGLFGVKSMQTKSKQTLKIYWQHLKKYRLMAVLICVSSIITPMAEIAAPLYYKKFFDYLAGASKLEPAMF